MTEIKISSQERTLNQPKVMLYVKMEGGKETKLRADASDGESGQGSSSVRTTALLVGLEWNLPLKSLYMT